MDGLFSGISALAEIVVELIGFALKSVSRLVLGCSPEMPVRERRKHLTFGLLGMGLVVAVVASIGGFLWYLDRPPRRRAEAGRLVEAQADQLDERIDNKNQYERIDSPLAAKDPWDNPLQIEYEDRDWGEALVVRSLGPDGVADTKDDIIERRGNVRAGDVARTAGAALAETARKRWKRGRDSQ